MTLAFFIVTAIALSPLVAMPVLSILLVAKLADERIASFLCGGSQIKDGAPGADGPAPISAEGFAESTHARVGLPHSYLRLKGPFVSHESGSEKLLTVRPRASVGSICRHPEKSMEAASDLAVVERDKSAPTVQAFHRDLLATDETRTLLRQGYGGQAGTDDARTI